MRFTTTGTLLNKNAKSVGYKIRERRDYAGKVKSLSIQSRQILSVILVIGDKKPERLVATPVCLFAG